MKTVPVIISIGLVFGILQILAAPRPPWGKGPVILLSSQQLTQYLAGGRWSVSIYYMDRE